jgi:DNA-binding NarL/FixJ family response regulator
VTGTLALHPTIVIAEDEQDLREALQGMLEVHGFNVVAVATTGTEAVSLAAALNPELVLMDYRMPELDGVTATESIKARNPDTQIVMFTAFDEGSLSLEATRVGASAFLVKGCAPSLILRALSSALQQRRGTPGALPPRA